MPGIDNIVTIISIVLTTIFGLISVLDYTGRQVPFFKKRSWKSVCKYIGPLASSIQNNNFKPDVVVGIEGGGTIVAGLLMNNYSSQLGGDFDFIIQRQHYVRDDKQIEKKLATNVPSLKIKGKKILLVDSLVYSGDTLKEVRLHLQSMNPEILKTAVVFRMDGTACEPDFYAKKVKRREVMPWSLNEEYNLRYSKW